MPSVSEKQRRYMGMELGRLRSGQATDTGMSESQLSDFAHKSPKHKSIRRRSRKRHNRSHRSKRRVYS